MRRTEETTLRVNAVTRVSAAKCDIYRRAAPSRRAGISYEDAAVRNFSAVYRSVIRCCSSFGYTRRAITPSPLALVKIAHCVWVQAERCCSFTPALFSVLEYLSSPTPPPFPRPRPLFFYLRIYLPRSLPVAFLRGARKRPRKEYAPDYTYPR